MPHQCTECGRTFDDGSKEMLSGCPDCGGNKFQFQPSSAKAEARKAAAADADSSADEVGDPAGSAGVDSTGNDTVEPTKRDTVDPGPAADTDTTADSTEPRAHKTEQTAIDQFDVGGDAEIDNSTLEEDRAQRDARSSSTTSEEIDAARQDLDESDRDRLGEVKDHSPSERRSTHGRGTPQGPPTDEPDKAAAEAFGLDGAVGGHDDQPTGDANQQPTADAADQPTTDGTNQATGDVTEQPEQEAAAQESPETDLSALREELNDQFESIKITAPGQYELNLMELYDRKEYIISLQEDGRYVVDIPEGHEYIDE